MTTDEKMRTATDLESTWIQYRRRVWQELPFEERMRNADISLRMTQAISRAIDVLRDGSSEDPATHGMLADVARELGRLKARIGKPQAM